MKTLKKPFMTAVLKPQPFRLALLAAGALLGLATAGAQAQDVPPEAGSGSAEAPAASSPADVSSVISPTIANEAAPDASSTGATGVAPKESQEAAPAVSQAAPASQVQTIPDMPPVIDARNIYSEASGPEKMSPTVANHLTRIYVPNLRGNSVSVIDPATDKVVDTFKVGRSPQHVVPSWDLKTLWVTNNSEGHADGSLTPIDPVTGKPGKAIDVDDPYNMYFTPDGHEAIVVAEAKRRLDFRDPHTMALHQSVEVPKCEGINHAAFSADGSYALFTCEFGRYMAKVDTVNHKLLGMLKLSKGGMPQDVIAAPDGHKFYVADMHADGVFTIDGDKFKETGFIPTGVGTHGLYTNRDATRLYVANRGSHMVHGPRHSKAGGVTVIDLATDKVITTWPIPGGGSPDMGNVTPDGKHLWLSGRFDDVVYDINTQTGEMKKVPVGAEPHGLTVWPQPGRYSIGHTGIMR
nr:YncE family protein [Oecophyllibacter saccharovorans]